MNLTSCSSNSCSFSSGILALTTSPIKIPKSCLGISQLGCVQKMRYLRNNGRVSKVTAYYGLRSPPYKLDALEPYMSQKTIEVHWGAHHRNYVEALNKQLEKNDTLYGCTMDELVKVTYNNGNPLPEFNNAAQVWNHDFFWESMQPGGGEMPSLGLLEQIEKDFASYANFKEKFIEAALTLFGSGWHAYYLDYKNDRAKYVNTFMDHLVSWIAAAACMARAQAFVNLGEPKIPVA